MVDSIEFVPTLRLSIFGEGRVYVVDIIEFSRLFDLGESLNSRFY